MTQRDKTEQQQAEQILKNLKAIYNAKKALEKVPWLQDLYFALDNHLKKCGQAVNIDFEKEFSKEEELDREAKRIAKTLEYSFVFLLICATLLGLLLL